MRRFIRFCAAALLAAALPLAPAGCSEGKDEGGGGDADIAETNDRNLVACIGDSITQGGNSEGAPIPRASPPCPASAS